MIIINETLAKRFWPDGDPLGKHIRFAGSRWEVVGVVGDAVGVGSGATTGDGHVGDHGGDNGDLAVEDGYESSNV